MMEAKNNEIYLELSGDGLTELLRFLYCEKVVFSKIKLVAEELLHASQMYQLNCLKKHC